MNKKLMASKVKDGFPKRGAQLQNEIKTRRSIRKFTPDDIDDETINRIIEMGTWAPSGLNNQPWQFVVVRDKALKEALSQQTRYSHVIQVAPVCIAVFLDHSQSYHQAKDTMAIGACIQNMLLTIHSMGLGAVWLGEVLKNRKPVERMLEVPGKSELMAIIALGRPDESGGEGTRRSIDEVIIGRK
jgi:nitroreductase